MAYLALYRKYRPSNFEQVVGQEYIVQILKNQIMASRIGHAYLLTGIRGTGKTSIAKIFARAINCPNHKGGNPCNHCEICDNINKPSVMDIIEIDAASNRGVDEIRDIRDKVKYPPQMGVYKVYIIDEVHMLTKEAFNALLKTLEEPPAHAVFILATTEPNKLPATILSRCQRFDIRPISIDKIEEQIQKILGDIGISIEKEGVSLIAQRGDHSMRDALSILDQVIDLGDGTKPITKEEILGLLGMGDEDGVDALMESVLNQDVLLAMETLQGFREKGVDSGLLMGQLIGSLRKIAIAKSTGSAGKTILEMGSSEYEVLLEKVKNYDEPKIYQVMDGLIEDRQKLKYTDLAGVILEMAILKYASLGEVVEEKAEQRRIVKEKKVQPQNKNMTKTSTPMVQPTIQQKQPLDSFDDLPPLPEWLEPPIDEGFLDMGVPSPQEERGEGIFESLELKEGATPPKITEGQKENPVQEKSKPKAPPTKHNDTSGATMDLQLIHRAMYRVVSPLFQSIFEQGQLKIDDNNHLSLIYFCQDAESKVDIIKSQKSQMEEAAKKVSGLPINLEIRAEKKVYEEMDFQEKTQAIIDDSRVKIKLKE